MRLTVNKEGYPYIFIALLAAALSSSFNFHLPTYFFLLITAFFAIFFRDPQRRIPSAKNILVAPADGRVKSIKNYGAYKEIHIFIGPFDVHINRAPLSGVVKKIMHKSGKHKMAFMSSSVLNEENYITLTSGKRKITVVQVVGIMARRIRCWISEKEFVKIGQPIGMILFGSGTKLIMPSNAKILVHKKQKVKAGETIVARF